MRKFFLFVLAACSGGILLAQEAEWQGAAKSVDPTADSLSFLKFRARMDSIRAREHRPTVALVLSGGGAKGAAHAGVLRYMEEKGIPVDAVLGTSMGGLVGGLYALGYPASYLDSLLRVQDWGKMLSDRIDRRFIPESELQYRSRYLFGVPFNFGGLYPLRLSASPSGDGVSGRLDAVSRSLPSGVVTGLNVRNLISEVSVGYHDARSFADLPVPYICVATDLVSCKAKNWTEGSFQQAMRSTMSIPGLFAPVRVGDMVLADGGMRNNFPTDLARAIGADYVIGVDLSQSRRTSAQVNNFFEMTDQMIEMLGRDAHEQTRAIPDIFIKPDLQEYNMMSFSSEAVDTIIARGYRAAASCAGEIDSLKRLMPSARRRLSAPPAVDLRTTPVRLSGIRFSGISDRDGEFLLRKLRIRPGDLVDAARIEEAVSRLWALSVFRRVEWSLLEGGEGSYELVFRCLYGPAHQFGAGVRADTEELVSALFNLGFNVHKLRSSRLNLEGKVGQNRYISAQYTYFDPELPTVNADVKVGSTSISLTEPDASYHLRYLYDRESFYFSGMQLVGWDLRAGIKHENYRPVSWLSNNGVTLGRDLKELQRDYVGVFGSAEHSTLDDSYYPSRGFSARVGYDLSFGEKQAHIVEAQFRPVLPFGNCFAVLPSLYARSVFGGDDNLFQYNLVGGSMAGRYVPHQMPFVGMHRAMLRERQAAVLNLSLRYQILKDTYCSLQGGVVRDAATVADFISNSARSMHGLAFEVAYNSVAGPFKFDVHWSDTLGWGAYLSLGFDF